MRSGTSSGVTRSRVAARFNVSSRWRNRAKLPSPVSASMRRRLAPIDPSDTTVIGPIIPSAPTWVPPQSSTDRPPASTTRTTSPYLSPKKAMAPMRSASSLVVS